MSAVNKGRAALAARQQSMQAFWAGRTAQEKQGLAARKLALNETEPGVWKITVATGVTS